MILPYTDSILSFIIKFDVAIGMALFCFIKEQLLNLRDICFPMCCCSCGEMVDSEGLCPKCWKRIKWVSDPRCRICGVPFELDISSLCPQCISKPPHFDQAISVFEYDDFSKTMILKFKHGDATYMGKLLAVWMHRVAAGLTADLIIPVPIHFLKRLKRRYNQTELLAMELERLCGVPQEPRILEKEKQTSPQEGLTRSTRLRNIKGSFGVNPGYARLLVGKKVILVDDVLTTGATVNECARILKKHGAEKVMVLTAARVNLDRVHLSTGPLLQPE